MAMTNIVQEAKKFANEAQLVTEQYVSALQQANVIIGELCTELERRQTDHEAVVTKVQNECDRRVRALAETVGHLRTVQSSDAGRIAYLTNCCDKLEEENKALRQRSLAGRIADWFRS